MNLLLRRPAMEEVDVQLREFFVISEHDDTSSRIENSIEGLY
jgi:hypothetical protein